MDKSCENCKYHDAPTTSGICLECLHIPATCALWEEKPQTNAGRIRAMSDEELAKLFISIQDDVANYYNGGAEKKPKFPTTSTCTWLDWLKQEAES